MISVSFHDDGGRILMDAQLASAAEVSATLSTLGAGGAVPGRYSGATHYVQGGAAVLRPALDLAESQAARVGEAWGCPAALPAVTEVTIDGEPLGAVDDGALEVVFPEPGAYRLRLDPPFPWRPADIVVDVA